MYRDNVWMVLALTNIHKEKENWFCGNVSFMDSAGKFLTQSRLQHKYKNPPLSHPCTAVYHYSFYAINKVNGHQAMNWILHKCPNKLTYNKCKFKRMKSKLYT